MDQIPCDVARDLMPLMAEGMASEDSEGLLKQHLSHCPACKAQYDSMGSAPAGDIVEQAPLRSLKKALRKRSLRGAFLAFAVQFGTDGQRVVFQLDSPDLCKFRAIGPHADPLR